MKQFLSTVAAAAVLAISAQAGSEYKNVTPMAPATTYGTGAYLGLQAGFNAYQRSVGGFVSTDSKVGGFGGLKGGYVFGTGLIRPAVELDAFYNGYSQDILAGGRNFGSFRVDSGAYLANGLVRFNLGQFQPYVGAGIGGYTAELSFRGVSNDHTSWAWQIVGGADYYFTQKISIFAEYKFLNYMDSSDIAPTNHVGQQLAGAGIRFHF